MNVRAGRLFLAFHPRAFTLAPSPSRLHALAEHSARTLLIDLVVVVRNRGVPMIHGAVLPFLHVYQRLLASARAGSFGLRKRASFLSYTIEQDGISLLVPNEPSLSVVFIPLALIVVALGAGAGFYS